MPSASRSSRLARNSSGDRASIETEPMPRYRRIAAEVNHLRQLGMSTAAIARHLGVDDKTVAKAIRRSVAEAESGRCRGSEA